MPGLSPGVRPALALCLVLPWLNGFTAGPMPNFWPVWGAAICGVALLLHWRRIDARLLAQAWLAAALVSSGIAVLQYFGQAGGFAPWVNVSAVGEAYGNLRQRNQFASLTSIGLLGLLALVSWRTPATERGAWPMALTYGAAALLALGNAASSSRTGFLQWLLILSVLLVAWGVGRVRNGKGRLPAMKTEPTLFVVLWASCCYAAFVFLLPRFLRAWRQVDIGSLMERLAGSGQDSRRVLWDNVLQLIAHKPWLGWGWGELDYAHFTTVYPGARFTELLDNAHNLPLHLAVELGLPVALALCLGLVALLWRARPWQAREPAQLLAWGVLGVIGVHSLLEYPLWYGPFQWTALFCAGLLWRLRACSATPALSEPVKNLQSPEPGRKHWAAAGLCWACLAVLALDYARVSQLYLPAQDRWPSYRQQPQAQLGRSLFFQSQVAFARLTTTALAPENAAEMHALALGVLHHSPEPRVVESVIASAMLLGREDDARWYLMRFKAAFPEASWRELLQRHPGWSLLPH